MAARKKEEETGIPPIVEDCIEQIRQRGLREDGILRVSGSAAQIKDLQNAYRKGKRIDLSNVYIHTVGGILKNYFRDMPKPILTFEAYDDFLACAAIGDESDRVTRLRLLISQLPIENQELLHKTLVFISEVSHYAEENQMHVGNLATMFAPTFLRKKDQDRAELLLHLQDVIAVTHTMILHTTQMFENWPDNQDRHPSRPTAPNKEKARKMKEAMSKWYGSDWEKELKRQPPKSPKYRNSLGSRQFSNLTQDSSRGRMSDEEQYPRSADEMHDTNVKKLEKSDEDEMQIGDEDGEKKGEQSGLSKEVEKEEEKGKRGDDEDSESNDDDDDDDVEEDEEHQDYNEDDD